MIIGFISGVTFTIVSFIVAYIIIDKLIFKYGKQVVRQIENKLNDFDNQTMDKTSIVYPNYTKEVFLQEDSTLEDNLQ